MGLSVKEEMTIARSAGGEPDVDRPWGGGVRELAGGKQDGRDI